jgi:hypothetical protein
MAKAVQTILQVVVGLVVVVLVYHICLWILQRDKLVSAVNETRPWRRDGVPASRRIGVPRDGVPASRRIGDRPADPRGDPRGCEQALS